MPWRAMSQFCQLLPAILKWEDLSGHDHSAVRAALWRLGPDILQNFSSFVRSVWHDKTIVNSSPIQERCLKQRLWTAAHPNVPGKNATMIRNQTSLSRLPQWEQIPDQQSRCAAPRHLR